jgi:hypothetical protein
MPLPKRTRNAKPLRAARERNSVKKRGPGIRLIPSFPRQVCWDVWLPALPAKFITTVTTGVITAGFNFNPTTKVQAFATRFGSTFDEYRVVQVQMKMKMFSSTNPGVVQAWIDENSTATATLAEAQERYVLSVSASSVEDVHQLSWTASDPLDLQYSPIATSTTPASFKAYTDNANFGSSIVITDYFELEARFRIQFRGLQGV